MASLKLPSIISNSALINGERSAEKKMAENRRNINWIEVFAAATNAFFELTGA